MKENRQLKRRVRNSYIVSTISLTLVLFLLGTVGYLMMAAMSVADTLQEGITMSVELTNEGNEAQRAKIKAELDEEVMITQIDFVGKDAKIADEEFRRMFESQFEEILEFNPLLDSFELRLSSASSDQALLNSLITAIESMEGVERVSFPTAIAQRVHSTVNRIRLILSVFGAVLLTISLILLNNTLRLAIFSKRYIINTMKMVGATKWFIIKPFLSSSLTQGLWAGVFASALFSATLYGVSHTIPELTDLAQMREMGMILAWMVVGGVVISVTFTYVAVNKFVNMKSNKIHLY